MALQDFVEVGDIVLDATGKAWAVVVSGSFPRFDAVPADGSGDTVSVDRLTEPVVVVARHGSATEIYSDDLGADLSVAPVADQPVPGDAPAPVEQG